jgi:hypothetical protein
MPYKNIMNYFYNSYKLLINFNYFLNFSYSSIIVNLNSRYFLFKLPFRFFFKQKKDSDNFIFLSRFHYITFIKHLFNFYDKLFTFYYFNLKLKGLGYRVFRISKFLIKIFLNRSNFFYLHISFKILLKYRTRRFFFISTDLSSLRVLVINLLLLKEFIIYRVNGIYYPRQILLIKPGKNKFR